MDNISRYTMIDEFSGDPYDTTEQTDNDIRTTVEYLQRKLRRGAKVMLDIGRRSPLTEAMDDNFNLDIYNTDGDLDEVDFIIPDIAYFDYIMYSHTIEHQFNPLVTLEALVNVCMDEFTTLFIILPNKPKFLWWEGHYHEIDHYRMKMLLKRAGLTMISYERHRVRRKWSFYLTGIRPLLRLFLEFNDYYEIRKPMK